MCGINGILSRGQAHLYSHAIGKMNDALAHRGPDDEGIYKDTDVLLGHRRLSIIDLSAAGKQPMSDQSRTLWLVFNGEIYNFKDIRRRLESRGYVFQSNTDTEVILHGYREWGAKVFEQLDGMFAFGLWDTLKKELYLVRDGCGVKPLFYFYDGEKLIFSSEIKGLLISGLVKREIHPQALSNFLSLFYVPGPESIIKNVKQVPPGSYICFPSGGGHKCVKFWDLNGGDRNKAENVFNSVEEVYEQLREEISIAVRNSVVSDVPVSLLLSSGLDSSLILNELKNIKRQDIDTLTIGFKEASYDESAVARKYAGDMGFNNSSFLLSEAEVPEHLEKMVYHLDALNANPCILAEYFYFKKAAEQYKVTLMGTGNDELFAGYSTYIADKYFTYYQRAPLFIRRILHSLSYFIPTSEKKYAFDYLTQKFTEGSLFHREKSHYWWRTIFSDEEKTKLLKYDFLKENDVNIDSAYTYQAYYGKTKMAMDFENQSLYSDFYLFLIDNANMEVDQLSMAFSLEVRPPFLTKRFAEFAFSVPYSLKLKGNATKYCLREAYKNILPDYILKRKKHGLVSPLDVLFKDTMKEFIHDHLFSPDMADFFNLNAIELLLKRQRARVQNNSYKLFSLLCFSIWKKHFINKTVG